MRRTVSLSLLLAVLLFSAAAFADTEVPIVSLTANPNGSVTGTLQNGMSVSFATAPLSLNGDDTLIVNEAGAPKLSIEAPDNSINNLSLYVVGGVFTDLSASLFGVYDQRAGGESCSMPDAAPTAMCDPMWITVNYTNGGSTKFQLTNLNTDPAGLNPFSVIAPSGDYISSIFIGGLTSDTQAKFYGLADISLSGAALSGTSVPEPSAITLFGAGLLVMVRKLRRG